GDEGKAFLKKLSETLQVPVRGWTDIYEILGTGEQVTFGYDKAKKEGFGRSRKATGRMPELKMFQEGDAAYKIQNFERIKKITEQRLTILLLGNAGDIAE